MELAIGAVGPTVVAVLFSNPIHQWKLVHKMINALEAIDRLKQELDALRPLLPDTLAQVEQKLRLESNYNSNAIEGNTLTLAETRNLILHGLTASGKPLRDHFDIKGHDSAFKAIEVAINDDQELNEVFIRNLHRILLKEPYEMEAVTPDGRLVKRMISIGGYKTTPNNVNTSTGETIYFTPPEQVKPAMTDLIDWYRSKEREREHPIIVAATFHYRFVRIHPFDDGNGRMARLLLNMILIKHGYTVAMIRQENREDYLSELEQADKTEDLTAFINYIAACCEYSLNLHLKADRGETIDDVDDIDKEIALFKRSLTDTADETLLAREYVASVLYPFYDYCQSKIKLFSDAFGRVRTYVSFFVTTTDGRVVTLCEDSASLPSFRDQSALPEKSCSISFRYSIYLTTFQGSQDEHVLIEVKNNADSHHCLWGFSIGSPRFRSEYAGRDLEELKKRFNEMLRKMIKNLERR